MRKKNYVKKVRNSCVKTLFIYLFIYLFIFGRKGKARNKINY